MYAYGEVTIIVCPCWPANTTNQSVLVTLTFDLLTLKVVSESSVTLATSMPILVFLGLSVLELFCQRDRRQTAHTQQCCLMPPPRGRGITNTPSMNNDQYIYNVSTIQ